MSESSIFHNVIINSEEECNKLLQAIEKSKNTKSDMTVKYDRIKGEEIKRLL